MKNINAERLKELLVNLQDGPVLDDDGNVDELATSGIMNDAADAIRLLLKNCGKNEYASVLLPAD